MLYGAKVRALIQVRYGAVPLISRCPTASTCYPGYRLIPDVGCYKVQTQRLNWGEARATCENDDAHLAIPDSPEELQALLDMPGQYHWSEMWVGIHWVNNQWETVEGLYIVTF